MSVSLVFVTVFIIASCGWVYSIRRNLGFILLHLALLLSTPWILVLSLSQPSLRSLPASRPRLESITANANFFSSPEFLFFSGDRRPGYGTIDYGMFLPSFLPLIALGFSAVIRQKRDRKYAFVIWWFISGLGIGIATSNNPVLPGSLWFVPSLSLLSSLGLYSIIDLVKKRQHPVIIGTALMVLSWFVYEVIRLYYILISWQPFTV